MPINGRDIASATPTPSHRLAACVTCPGAFASPQTNTFRLIPVHIFPFSHFAYVLTKQTLTSLTCGTRARHPKGSKQQEKTDLAGPVDARAPAGLFKPSKAGGDFVKVEKVQPFAVCSPNFRQVSSIARHLTKYAAAEAFSDTA